MVYFKTDIWDKLITFVWSQDAGLKMANVSLFLFFPNCKIASKDRKLSNERSLSLYIVAYAISIYSIMCKSKISVITLMGQNYKKHQYSCWGFSIVLSDLMHLLHRHEEGLINIYRIIIKYNCKRKKSLYIINTLWRSNPGFSCQQNFTLVEPCPFRYLQSINNMVLHSQDCSRMHWTSQGESLRENTRYVNYLLTHLKAYIWAQSCLPVSQLWEMDDTKTRQVWRHPGLQNKAMS